MSTPRYADEQVALWNGAAGRAWVDAQELLDDIYRPIEQLLADVVPTGSPSTVLGDPVGTTSASSCSMGR